MLKVLFATVALYWQKLQALLFIGVGYLFASLGLRLVVVTVSTTVLDQGLNYLLGLLASVQPVQLGQLLDALAVDHFLSLIFAGIAWRISRSTNRKPSILVA